MHLPHHAVLRRLLLFGMTLSQLQLIHCATSMRHQTCADPHDCCYKEKFKKVKTELNTLWMQSQGKGCSLESGNRLVGFAVYRPFCTCLGGGSLNICVSDRRASNVTPQAAHLLLSAAPFLTKSDEGGREGLNSRRISRLQHVLEACRVGRSTWRRLVAAFAALAACHGQPHPPNCFLATRPTKGLHSQQFESAVDSHLGFLWVLSSKGQRSTVVTANPISKPLNHLRTAPKTMSMVTEVTSPGCTCA